MVQYRRMHSVSWWKKHNKRVRRTKTVVTLLLSILLPALIVSITVTYITSPVLVPSGSMEPTLEPGHYYLQSLINKNPRRGNIIVFHHPDSGVLFVKRVIGVTGDTIDIVNGSVIRNGLEISEDYLLEPMDKDGLSYHFVVPKDSVFVLGDNRNNSNDARFWTTHYVPLKNITGIVYYQIYPSLGSVK